MIRKLSLLFTVFGCAFAHAQQTVRFEGTVTGPWQGHAIYLYNNITGDKDSARIENGRFVMKRPFGIPTRYLFYTSYDIEVNKGYAPFGILVEKPGTIRFAFAIDSGLVSSNVRGSEPHALYARLMEALESAADDTAKSRFIEALVSDHPASYASVFVLDRLGGEIEVNRREQLFNLLPDAAKSSHEGKRVAARINGEKQTAPGATVQDFTLKKADGTSFSFSELKGKYVLIDFWASWCVPCIQEFPHIKEAYAAYKGNGFEVLGISTDKSKEAWLNALENHQPPWIQVRDNEGDEAIALAKFAVSVLPTSYLVNPDGKIIARDLRGDELLKKLIEIFGDKQIGR